MSRHILLIDDDENLLRVTEYNLASAGFEVSVSNSGEGGLRKFRAVRPDLVITDVNLGDLDGLQVLEAIKRESPDTPVIVFTAFGTIDMAVKAMQKGAFNFITKPFDRETLRLSCNKALELDALRRNNRILSKEVDRLAGAEGMDSASSAMKDLLATTLKVADSEATIMITGESGTGKEVLARLIHRNSPRNQAPLVAINCAAIPETLIESELFGHVKGAFTGAIANRRGRFQAATGGTLFLDEITELKIDMQAKLLRALQEREVEPVGSERCEKIDIRVIAASNKDLRGIVEKGEFREDLYYRLNVIPLHIPPLRERREDMQGLLTHFLKKFGMPLSVAFSSQALEAIKRYHWPGNIRELQNMVERCVILRKSDSIDLADLNLPRPETTCEGSVPEIPAGGISLAAVEKGLIEKALARSRGNRSEAARLLSIPRHVLIYRLEKYGIQPA